MKSYTLLWRGQRSGPYSIEQIEEKLGENEISLWHEVEGAGTATTVGELLQAVTNERRQVQLEHERQLERQRMEARQRAERDHREALQRLQEENDALADELDTVRAAQAAPKLPQPTNAPVYPVYHVPVVQRTSGQAITAFVFSLLNFVPGVNLISWLIAIILAHSALSDMRRDPTLGGHGLAMAALWITYTLLFVGLIFLLLVMIGAQTGHGL